MIRLKILFIVAYFGLSIAANLLGAAEHSVDGLYEKGAKLIDTNCPKCRGATKEGLELA